jgi:agmatine deiminase
MSAAATPRREGFYMPAEWERHEAIWLSWPHDPVTFAGVLPEVERTYARVIREIHACEEVRLLVLDEGMRRRVEGLLEGSGVDLAKVRFHLRDYADVWIRDYGPTFLIDRNSPRTAMTHWIFNAWGGKYEELLKDSLIPDSIREEYGIPAFKPGVVMEGGSFDVNGRGTVLTTEQCLLNRNRNPGLDRAGIEEVLRDFLGASRVLWLNRGVEGDDTDGHIDDVARFVSPRSLLCALEDDRMDANYPVLKENFESLSRMRDQDGLDLEVTPLPMPDPVEGPSGRLPASYANFYIGNGVVLAPVFGCPSDDRALQVIERALPNRRVAPIPCRDLVRGLGTIHCCTQQQPARAQAAAS